MRIRSVTAGFVLVVAALCGASASAGAQDDPWIPRNVVPPGEYLVIAPPQGPIPTTFSGTPLQNCRVYAFEDRVSVDLVCAGHRFAGRQAPHGPNESYLTFGASPLGLALTPQATTGYWMGSVTIVNTSTPVYPAGFWIRPLPL
ncbi:hypothetical protein [Nocardia flavorosea]|uniref:hypothetical protein n=1 Tax=Nocardia flavorosea TaxID=53429 RepID=UPI0024575A28|nr:hypothetical protein [Nocardia flavorosea]